MVARSLLSALSGGLEGWANAFFGSQAEETLVCASAHRRHVWCAIWSQLSLRADRVEQPEDIDQWRVDLKRLSSRKLLARAGFARATGFRTALAKLAWTALETPQAYLDLADTLEAGGPRAKLLHHLQTLDLRAIELVATLSDAACSASTFASLRADARVTPMMLKRLAWRQERIAILTAPKASRAPNLVSEALVEHGDLNRGLPFPAAPWLGTIRFKPLDTQSKLESAALRFANCLANQMRYVWLGCAYFYELDGLAIVEFERVADVGREIVQVRGPKNQAMTWEATVSLRRELTTAPDTLSRILPSLGECTLDY